MFPLFPVISGLTKRFLRPDGDVAAGDWLDAGGGAPSYTDIDEVTANDGTDYIKDTTTNGSIFKATFSDPVGTPVGTVTFRCRIYADDGVDFLDGVLEVREGGTQRASIIFGGTGSAWTTVSTTVTGVSNWNNLEFWCSRDTSGLSGSEYRVTQVEIEYES